jgi:hypothetical protein
MLEINLNLKPQPFLHAQQVCISDFIFANISGIFDHSLFNRPVSKHFHNPQPKEACHEDFPVRHPFFQLPEDEREKKIHCATMSSSSAISRTISAI